MGSMQEFADTSTLFGSNAPFIEELYEAYLADPASVSDEWRKYFDELRGDAADVPHAAVVESFRELARNRRVVGAMVDVSSGSVHIAIPPGPGTGTTTFQVVDGGGTFAPYDFAGDSIGTSPFQITSGSGTLNWDTGEGSFVVHGRATALGFDPVVASASGDFSVDFVTDEVTIAQDSVAVELDQSVLPGPTTPWLVLGAGGVVAVIGALLRRRSASA